MQAISTAMRGSTRTVDAIGSEINHSTMRESCGLELTSREGLRRQGSILLIKQNKLSIDPEPTPNLLCVSGSVWFLSNHFVNAQENIVGCEIVSEREQEQTGRPSSAACK